MRSSVVLLTSVVLFFACGLNVPTLKRNISLWESKKTKKYAYNLDIECFCSDNTSNSLRVEVNDDTFKVVDLSLQNQDVTNEYRNYATIPTLFNLISQAYTRKPQSLEVKYNREYGYPALIIIDPVKKVMDDEMVIKISKFEVINSK